MHITHSTCERRVEVGQTGRQTEKGDGQTHIQILTDTHANNNRQTNIKIYIRERTNQEYKE